MADLKNLQILLGMQTTPMSNIICLVFFSVGGWGVAVMVLVLEENA